jgi:hypothetical protein
MFFAATVKPFGERRACLRLGEIMLHPIPARVKIRHERGNHLPQKQRARFPVVFPNTPDAFAERKG